MDDDVTRRESPSARPPAATSGAQKRSRALGFGEAFAEATLPRAIGRFLVERQLGVGGMGVVLLARDPDLDRMVAIKVLHDGGETELARARLMREAQAMARLRHPNVVTLHEAGTHEGRIYLAMEYLPGGTLGDWLRAQRVIGDAAGERLVGWEELVPRFVAAGRGLAAAHAAGLVHRDFKPDNVFIDAEGRALVGDFGLAGSRGAPTELDPGTERPTLPDAALAAPHLTATGEVMGTPIYMSPEQHLAKPTDGRTDQFAFCAALYEALFGVRPFAGTTYEALRTHALAGALTPPRPGLRVPRRIAAAVRRGLSVDPAARFESMDALLAALEAAPAPASRPPRRALAVAGAVTLAALAAFGWWVRTPPSRAALLESAAREARARDCELVTVNLPARARLVGVETLAGAPAERHGVLATGQLAVPRGYQLLVYTVDAERYRYALRSNGGGAARTLTLPTPERRAGYRFVPGGDVPVGDDERAGDPTEQPASELHLEPYLLALTEVRDPARAPDGWMPYALALQLAREAHARLPTAAEWEWAARLGLADTMLTDRWEWTATRYAPYPYTADGRDDALAGGDTREVRGGQRAVCADASQSGRAPCGTDSADRARPTRRLEGRRDGPAELRLARTPAGASPEREVSVRVITRTSRPEPGVERTEWVVSPMDLVALHGFVIGWWALEPTPALQLSAMACPVLTALLEAGVDGTRLEVLAPDTPGNTPDLALVRWNPNPTFHQAAVPRCITRTAEESVFEPVCFDGDSLLGSSAKLLDSVAEVLQREPHTRLRLVSYVAPGTPDAAALSQRRAERVRDQLVTRGVASERLLAHGAGDTDDAPDASVADGASHAQRLLLGDATRSPCPEAPRGGRGRFEFQLVR